MQKQKTIGLVVVLGILTGCGGSATTTTSSQVNYSTVTVFSDSAGVFRGVSGSGGAAVGISPEVASVVRAANTSSSDDTITTVDRSSFALLSSNALGKIRQGTVAAGSTTVNVTIYENNSGDSGVVLFEVPSEGNLLFAAGSALSGYPSGSFTYYGQHAAGRRIVNATPELGSFALVADFNNDVFGYSGTTASTQLTGSGVIDKTNGRIAGSGFSLATPYGTYSATVHGNFHGTNAAEVTGIFHTNDTNPDYAGGFVGAR
jgi:hypothetical protein